MFVIAVTAVVGWNIPAHLIGPLSDDAENGIDIVVGRALQACTRAEGGTSCDQSCDGWLNLFGCDSSCDNGCGSVAPSPSPSVPLPPGLIEFREFAHIHAPFVDGEGWTREQGGGGGSTHLCVSHADASAIVERGWGEWHPVAQPSMPHVMVYAPRDEGELRVALAALEASYAFVTSAKR